MRFRDDGGTPAWRANQATFDPRRPRRGAFKHTLVLIVFFAFVLPWLLIFGAPALGALWDAVTR